MRWVSDMKVKGSLWSCLRVKNCSFRTHLEVLECSGQKAKKVLLSVVCSAKCKQTQQLPTLCKWMQQLPTMLGSAVHHGKDIAHKTLETMCNAHVFPQQCWKGCANGSNIVALCFSDHGTNKNVEELLANNVACISLGL